MFNKLSETNPEQGKMKLQSPVKINSKTNQYNRQSQLVLGSRPLFFQIFREKITLIYRDLN